jgi:dolichol-phosphate mannosyltransferase
MDVSVVIPVNNEAGNIERLLNEIDEALTGRLDYEIVVVDDGSSDETPMILRDVQRRNPRLRVLQHEKCCGQSTSVVTGVWATRSDIVATLDGDGQNDPHDIPEMVAALRSGHATRNVQLIAGHRQKRNDTAWRKFCSRIANRVRMAMLRDDTPDSGCGSKVFFRETFLRLPYFNHMHRFLPALVLRAGGCVQSVPVHHRERDRGRSHYGTLGRMTQGIVDLCGVMWLIQRSRVAVSHELAAMPRLHLATDNAQTLNQALHAPAAATGSSVDADQPIRIRKAA